jgi:hypothetical protein
MESNITNGQPKRGKKQIAFESLAGQHLESIWSFLFFYYKNQEANISGEEDKQMGWT